MCGFLAEYSFDGNEITDANSFKSLLDLSKHRGPDATNIYSADNYQLGFNRLAILDISENGNQPKYSPSKRYHLVFNGEIYNYRELQERYQLTDLRSTSDTEVVVHLLDKIGFEQTIEKLNGMFAMAIVDSKSNQFYLVRDFAGIKPLFYGVSNNGLVAASQFDQIFKHQWFSNELELRADTMKEYFGFGYMQAPNTIYNNIFHVNPGEFIQCSRNGTILKQTYKVFNSELKIQNSKKNEGIEQIKKLLNESVKQQLVSDVPLATFLSGGIDSPLITAMAKIHNPEIEAFTLEVDDKILNESEAASKYAEHLSLKHQIKSVSESELVDQIDAHFKNLPEPFGDYSSIPTYLITKKASKENTVMLSGDGGDELFFGYPRMLDVLKKYRWFSISFIIRKPLIRLFIKLRLTNSWAPYNYKTLSEWVKEKHTYIFKTKLESFFPEVNFSKELETLYNFENESGKNGLLQNLRYNEFYGHMQRVLIKVDRMSMANSLEVRVPFLDKHVIEEAFKHLPDQFDSSADLKKILKILMKDYYPETLIFKKKKGFAVPIEKWLKNQLNKDVKRVIFEKPFYGEVNVNLTEIKSYVDDFYNDKHQEAWGIWHIYAWQKWAEKEELI